ncbi:MFS transporter [Tabrizicola fusiformis]|uniref:MFS transporter n=1 Tax=Tabrizicola sp. SY72 TaxID=2741673 RepID=UPI00157292B1|nr:MFS transporter [Tabrizicola sp. SY72]NTT88322.1 MFS transporter [Tabrizicola sp. SY72]
MPPPTSPLAPLRHPAFRLIWTATLVSNLGWLIQGVGAGWLMAELTPSHDMVALVQGSTTLPIMILAVAAGALADNFDRRKVMLAAQLFMGAVSVLLSVAAWGGWLGPWSLLCFTFLLGLGSALHLPAWQASMRDLVPREDLPAAVTLNSMSFNLMRSIGPALGGVIVAAAGAAAAFAINAVSYLAVIFALFRWNHRPERGDLPAERLHSAIWAGLRYVALSPNLMRVMARASVFGLSAVVLLALLPVVTRDTLQGGATTYGLLLGAFGLGAIGGALASPQLRRRAGIEAIVACSFLAFGAGTVLVAVSTTLWLVLPGLLMAGAAWVSALSLFNVSTQLATPRWVVGRALAVYQTATFGGMALGSWLWGWISEVGSPQTALLIAAGVMVAGAALGRVLPMPDFSDVNLDPANRFHEPALRLDLKARSGPILVMIDWEIPPANTDAFLALMADRRRIRLRDGVGQWALLRDLETPDIWVESYHVPTWVEYIRHNQRRTQADSQNWDRLMELHRGPEPPRIHRMIERETVPLHDDLPILENPKIL